MSFLASARKYRPQRFEDVVGQEHVAMTLKNALKNDKLSHAFLFTGPRGVGKTTCARILAKVLNCLDRGDDFEPCNKCDSCNSFNNSSSSFNIIELDAASNNTVEHIRNLNEQVRFQPQKGTHKVFIIDEVHMLSQAAFNAFLKTLEEPPEYAVFILATTEKHKIIPTILSRCQIYDFKRIPVGRMVTHLESICKQEGITAEKEALAIIAQKADGALRDSLSIYDRIAGSVDKTITYDDVIKNLNVLDYDYYFRFVEAMVTEDLAKVMLIFNEITQNGFEPDLFINGLAEHFRNLLVAQDEATIQLLEQGDALKAKYLKQAKLVPASFLLSGLNVLNNCDINYKMAKNKRLHVEMSLIKLTYINRALSEAPAAPMPAAPANTSNKRTSNVVIEKIATPNVAEVPIQQPTNSFVGTTESVETESVQTKKVEEPSEEIQKPEATEQSTTEPTQETIEQPVPEQKPKPAAPPIKKKIDTSSNPVVPMLSDLSSMMASVEEEEKNEVLEQQEVTLEALQAAWEKYMDSKDNHVKSVMKFTQVRLDGEKIKLGVGTKLAKNTLLQELEIVEFIRKELRNKDLIWEIDIDEALAPPAPEKPVVKTGKEKFIQMVEVNPLIKEALTLFDLKPEE